MRYYNVASARLRETNSNSARIGYAEVRFESGTMHPVVAFLLNALALYAAVGAVTAVAFALFGATRVQGAAVSPGARILILPGALALWPYVLVRWIKAKAS